MATCYDKSELSTASVATLVQRAAEQSSRLVRDELRLARAELVEKGRRAGFGASLLGSGGVVAMYGLGVLAAAAVLGLAEVMPGWLAALIVAAVLFLAAVLLATLGRNEVRQAIPGPPERTSGRVHEDIEAVTAAVREGGAATSAVNRGGR